MKRNIRQFIKMKLAGFIVIGIITGAIIFLFAFAPKQKIWTVPPSADKVTNPVASDTKSLVAGKAIYTKNCYDCHGKKGKGDGPKSAELDKPVGDFTKENFSKQSDGAIFWKITEGRKPMPSFKKDITEEQRWQVINYVRTLGIKK
jgi:mono/diheme cytochrome c family protein